MQIKTVFYFYFDIFIFENKVACEKMQLDGQFSRCPVSVECPENDNYLFTSILICTSLTFSPLLIYRGVEYLKKPNNWYYASDPMSLIQNDKINTGYDLFLVDQFVCNKQSSLILNYKTFIVSEVPFSLVMT
jgi:hypothetical protein